MGLSLQLITLFCLAVGIHAVCDTGFQWYDGNCYHIAPGAYRRGEAINYCNKRRSHMLVIHSAVQQAWIYNQFGIQSLYNANIWIGLTNNNGVYEWVDGSPLDYTDWYYNSPSYGTAGVVLGGGYQWTDVLYGADSANFGCMYPTTEVPPVTPQNPICRIGYMFYDGDCYSFSPGRVSFSAAVASCRNNNSTIASIHGPQFETYILKTQALLKPYQPVESFWVGMSLEDGVYTNDDGTFVDYYNWDEKSPSGKSDRVQLVSTDGISGKWSDSEFPQANFVCKYSP